MGHSRDTVDTRSPKRNNPNMTPPLQTLVTVIILVVAIVRQTTAQIKKIAKKAAQVMENMTREASRNKIIKNIKDFHRTTTSAITVVTNATDRANHNKRAQINNKTTRYSPGTRELGDGCGESCQLLTSRTCSCCDGWCDQLQRSFRMFYAKTKHRSGNTRTQHSK